MDSTAPDKPQVKVIHVAVGMVLNGGTILIARRPDHLHQGGLWEFPGGKVEEGESVQEALARELEEEVGITADTDAMESLTQLEFDYGDKVVLLDTWLCHAFSGQAHGKEGQPIEWVNINNLDNYTFPEANATLIEKLREK
ncbi:8-oxo-dGTP diphosphatase MutT [Saccharospirillum salsuginis]|uniref:8-oxo-dGTP diphosphatase n=1 Tax=Saccharospirillum salsuginis TaxID=418750 RepID=A0A918KP33_9GAMM|nr:8-oxo-dGTP diphosphatase MutT [Saccharospirillum salsuginis]GGX69397.1 hypothetical protein GCM10007392_41210 [Saccharospirillum salsuginis]